MQQSNIQKFNVIVEAPILNRSGYGNWADALLTSLIKYPLFDVKIIPCGWGNCVPRNSESSLDAEIMKRVIRPTNNIPEPDIFISVTIPHIIKPVGKIFNINFCAGLEVDQCPDSVMNGLNQYDLNITLSEFSKLNYMNSKIKPIKPVEVVQWGHDTNIFKQYDTTEDILKDIPNKEIFLYVGQITSHNLHCDRKNLVSLIKDFSLAFKGKADKPALLVKTSGVNFSIYDRDTTLERIRLAKEQVPDNDVDVYLLHGELTDNELSALYNNNRVIAFVSETRGEGQGGSIAQMALIGKPTIVPAYSGYMDFLDSNSKMCVPGSLTQIPDEAVSEYYVKGSKWYEVDHKAMQKTLHDFYYDTNIRAEFNRQAKEAIDKNRSILSLEAMDKNLTKILNKYLLH